MARAIFYRVEFDDGANQVVFSFTTTVAPYAFAVGDFVDPSGWTGNRLAPDEHYTITAVEHQLTDPGGESEEMQHNVLVSIEAAARNADKSGNSV